MPLSGLRVIDAATLAAGPLVATTLGEFGAEVIKVEQPGSGDPLRTWGARRGDVGLVWKSVSRNKKCVTLDLRSEVGRDLLDDLLSRSDVFIINTRPSTLERWGLDYASLHERHPRLVMLHVTGYGGGGPASDRPGFGTLAEAMSGFAHVCGQPDGPPTLPPFMLADGVAAQAATNAVLVALYHRDVGGGKGQLIDISLVEPLARLIVQSTLAYDQLGVIPGRNGNRDLMASSAMRARRCELATPASNEHMCEVAARARADLVFLDLEDACAPAVKEDARATAVAALTELDWGTTLRAVRINGLDTPWCYGDIVEVVSGARAALDVIIVPKVLSAREVWWVDVLLTQLEAKLGLERPIALEALIEEAEGLLSAQEIARSSPRLEALIFGAGDLSASLRSRVDGNFMPVTPYPVDYWHAVRVQVLAAARAAGIAAIDAPFPGYHDEDAYRREATQASLLGYDGKWAIHPSQVSVALDVFTPSDAEVEEAQRIMADYRSAEARGVGAIGRGGKLVDAAMMRHAENVLRRVPERHV